MPFGNKQIRIKYKFRNESNPASPPGERKEKSENSLAWRKKLT
jgi:hypothetical protein